MESVKRYLQRNKIHQKDLATKVGATEAQISRILNGKRGASKTLLTRIANATRIPLGTLAKEVKPDGRSVQ